MKTIKIRNSILLIITALIWGIAFVAQSEGGSLIGPYSFNCIRQLMGSAVLVPVIMIFGRSKKEENKRELITGGVICGIIMFVATNLQQIGLHLGATAGKAGFLTACYILIVPVLGIFFRRKCGINVWIGVVLTLGGLYLLCINGAFRLQLCDALLMLCALCFAFHIMAVDRYSPLVSGVKLSCIQFLVSGILSAIPMYFVDMGHSVSGIKQWAAAMTVLEAWIPLLYAGIMSCGVAYTLQIIGQAGINPTLASLLMSLESVFSALAGWIILGENMSGREIAGCILIFSAIVLAQIPLKKSIKQCK